VSSMSSSGLDNRLLHDAVRDSASDVIGVAHEVGASAAQMGVPLHEVLDHVERAFAPEVPLFAVTRAAAVAWSEAALVHHADISCEDPLTSLVSVRHLRTRLAEVYRGADRGDVRVADRHALVVIELPRTPRGHELELSLRALDVGEVLRSVFRGDETFAQLTSRRFAALVGRERVDDLTMAMLGILLDRTRADHGQTRLWVEQLPASEDGVAQVLAGLCD
jgi:hypothetical protein